MNDILNQPLIWDKEKGIAKKIIRFRLSKEQRKYSASTAAMSIIFMVISGVCMVQGLLGYAYSGIYSMDTLSHVVLMNHGNLFMLLAVVLMNTSMKLWPGYIRTEAWNSWRLMEMEEEKDGTIESL